MTSQDMVLLALGQHGPLDEGNLLEVTGLSCRELHTILRELEKDQKIHINDGEWELN